MLINVMLIKKSVFLLTVCFEGIFEIHFHSPNPLTLEGLEEFNADKCKVIRITNKRKITEGTYSTPFMGTI